MLIAKLGDLGRGTLRPVGLTRFPSQNSPDALAYSVTQELPFAQPARSASFLGRFDMGDTTLPVQVVRSPASTGEHQHGWAFLLVIEGRFVDVTEFLLAGQHL